MSLQTMQKPAESIPVRSGWDLCGERVGVSTIWGWVGVRLRVRIRASGGGQNGHFGFDFRACSQVPCLCLRFDNPMSISVLHVGKGRGCASFVQVLGGRETDTRGRNGESLQGIGRNNRTRARMWNKTITPLPTFHQ